jgi:hypothetical protein
MYVKFNQPIDKQKFEEKITVFDLALEFIYPNRIPKRHILHMHHHDGKCRRAIRKERVKYIRTQYLQHRTKKIK